MIWKICLSLLLLATAIHGNFDALEKQLKKMAKSGETIDDLFVPCKDGTLGRGAFGLVFKGTKVGTDESVALKFVSVANRTISDEEFRIYGYLGAVNNTNVEKFGIPALHYYNEWKGFMITALSYFDGGDLDHLFLRGYFDHKNASVALNSFLLFRDFVIQSKYMHSRGVRHDDIKPGNIVVRGRRSFLIDFNTASKMTEDNSSGTVKFLPRKAYNSECRTPKSDWESFLYTMAYVNEIEMGWFWFSPLADRARNQNHHAALVGVFMKNNTDYLMSKINDAPFASPALKRVFNRFATEALYGQDCNPAYDQILEMIEKEMGGIYEAGQYKVFTWLEGHARDTASREYVDFNLRNLNVRRSFEGFNYQDYPLDFFPKPIPKKRSFSFFSLKFGGNGK